MTQENKQNRPSAAPALVGGVLLLALAVFVGWGAWKASNPAPVPLQGMVDAKTISVASKVPGRVLNVLVTEGAQVKPGDVVAELSLPEIDAKLGAVKAQEAAAKAKEEMAMNGARIQEKEAARADLARAKAGFNFARSSYQRLEALYKEGLIAAQQFDEVKAKYQAARELVAAASAKVSALDEGARVEDKEAAKALVQQARSGVEMVESLVREARVVSPVEGEVTRIVMDAGEVVPAGFPIVLVTDLKDVWVSFNVREDELKGFKMGGTLKGRVPALDREVEFRIDWINPRGEYATWRATRQNTGYDLRTFEVRARATAPVEGLRPGMSVIVER